MFLKFSHIFSAKRKFEKYKTQLAEVYLTASIKRIGILIDVTHFEHAENFVKELKKNFGEDLQYEVVLYSKKIKKSETYAYPCVDRGGLNPKGSFSNIEVESFSTTNFDVLINFYEDDYFLPQYITSRNPSTFKIGIHSNFTSLNHLIIQLGMSEFILFTQELKKYLEIIKNIK